MYSVWATPAYMTLHHLPHARLHVERLLSPPAAPTTPPFESHLGRGGFPHSDICGSKLVCQLPAAFRRLPRPSSPVIAKASTACTYSLDPITVNAPPYRPPCTSTITGSHALGCATPSPFCRERVSIQSYNPVDPAPIPPTPPPTGRPFARAKAHPRRQIEVRAIQPESLTSSSLLKNSRLL